MRSGSWYPMIGYRWNLSGRNERKQFAIGATHLNFTSSDDGEYGVNHVGKISPPSKARGLLRYGYHHPSGSCSSIGVICRSFTPANIKFGTYPSPCASRERVTERKALNNTPQFLHVPINSEERDAKHEHAILPAIEH